MSENDYWVDGHYIIARDEDHARSEVLHLYKHVAEVVRPWTEDDQDPFKPGDWAEHKSGFLDPREVTEVSEDGSQIKLWIIAKETDWLPAANYNRLEQE